jgi:hypothetical protein
MRRDQRKGVAAAPDWSQTGGIPGAAPASGPGFERGQRPVDGV